MHRLAVAWSLCLASCTAALGQSAAQPAPKAKLGPEMIRWMKETPEEILKRLDKNGDGYLNRDEAPPFLRGNFDSADRNGDGKLDRKEIALVQQRLRQRFGKGAAQKAGPVTVEQALRRLMQMDTDGDGKVSRAEARGRLAENFDRFDLNKDGYLDRSELRRVAQLMVAAQQGQGPGGARGLDFDALDRNADGRLTRDEVRGTPLEAAFDQIDTNHDGRIDPREFEAWLRKRQESKKDAK